MQTANSKLWGLVLVHDNQRSSLHLMEPSLQFVLPVYNQGRISGAIESYGGFPPWQWLEKAQHDEFVMEVCLTRSLTAMDVSYWIVPLDYNKDRNLGVVGSSWQFVLLNDIHGRSLGTMELSRQFIPLDWYGWNCQMIIDVMKWDS